jgi:hypothetical protein
VKFLKKENTGNTEASQRIMTSSSRRLTIVTSTIRRIFSFVLASVKPASNSVPISLIRLSSGRASQVG